MQRQFKVEAESQDTRLDVYLSSQYPDISREQVKKHILAGAVLIDGEVVTEPKFKVKLEQLILSDIEPESKELLSSELTFKKVFENDDFLVIDKPPGMVVHPGAGIKEGTVANALIAQYPEIAEVGHPTRPGIVHRLDKDTSGLLLIAKNSEAFDYAKHLFKSRDINKEYTTLVYGELENKHGFIEEPLLLDPARKRVKISPEGRPAKTEYYKKAVYRASNGVDIYTLVRVILHTGRMHQIRVHFASIGHPIAGDALYGKSSPVPEGLTRQFLHATRLMFTLPDGTALDLEASLPEDLQEVLNHLQTLEIK